MKMVKRYQIMSSAQEIVEDTFSPPFCWYKNAEMAKECGRDHVSGWWQETDLWQTGCRILCCKRARSLEAHGFEKRAIGGLGSNICMGWGNAKGCVISFSISCWDWERHVLGSHHLFVVSLKPFPRLLEVLTGAGCALHHQPSPAPPAPQEITGPALF